MKLTFSIILFAILLALDLGTKELAQSILSSGSMQIFKDFQLILAFNKGIAFSLPLPSYASIFVSGLLLIGLTWYTKSEKLMNNVITSSGITLIFAGAFGNMIEKILHGAVTDFIQVFSWFPIFNFADIYIFIGVMLLLYFDWFNKKS